MVCDAIGEIGGTLMNDEEKTGDKWPELVSNLWEMFK